MDVVNFIWGYRGPDFWMGATCQLPPPLNRPWRWYLHRSQGHGNVTRIFRVPVTSGQWFILMDVSLTTSEINGDFGDNFYRATLCVRAVLSVGRCPSVCPSVTFMYCIQTAKDIVKLLSHPGNPIILVSCGHIPRSKGNLLSGGAKYTGVWKKYAIFDWIRHFNRKRYTR